MKISSLLIGATFLFCLSSISFADTYCGAHSYCNNMKVIFKNESSYKVIIDEYTTPNGSQLALEPNYSKNCQDPWDVWDPNDQEIDAGQTITVYGHEVTGDVNPTITMTIGNSADDITTAQVTFNGQTLVTDCNISLSGPEITLTTNEHVNITANSVSGKGTDASITITIANAASDVDGKEISTE